MKSLELEAFDYAKDNRDLIDPEFQAFIAGANSKWVQAELIKAKIEVLYTCIELTDIGIRNKANELEKQLKELQDGRNS